MSDILQLGHPQLRQVAQTITDFADGTLNGAIEAALAQLVQVGGVGIAAPQVGSPWRWCILASHPTPRYPDAPQMSPLVLLNPTIVECSTERDRGWEGCLSVPGVRGFVPRSRSVTVTYQTRQAEARSQTFTDFVARIVQHECDHLAGQIFLDRVESTHHLMSEPEYRRQILKLPADVIL